MKIDSSPPKSPLASGITPIRNESAGGISSPAPGNSASSAVDLSAAARQLSQLQNSNNDINGPRVNELRAAIAAGQLKVDPSRIADGLIASVRDLLK
ncbi:MAG: flagellar biosynthesis anti-sigma factor FlgM [Candidimonas sp.]|nr:MAG: flagellar biosynthesis anti-sigma factor FlgM [Candidimonas sp.]TAM25582.1 MAG: flagellar biosynthesis anti-sigma factor FlgM [Candidimonas sp.]